MPETVIGQSGKPVSVATVADIAGDTPSVPVATTSTAGIVKVGDRLSVAADGTLSSPLATGAVPGMVMIGSGFSYVPSSGMINVAAAASNVTGGVKQGVAVTNVGTQSFTDIAGAQTSVNTVAAQLNALLAALRTAGVIASS